MKEMKPENYREQMSLPGRRKMRKYKKRLLAGILAFALAVGSAGCAKDDKEVKKDIKSQLAQSVSGLDTLYETEEKSVLQDETALPAGNGTSDWTAIALTFSGKADSKAQAAYLERLEAYVRKAYEQSGGLSKVKATEYHRIALTMLALGGDPEKVKGASGEKINLVADGIWNFTNGDPRIQGANGLCYALLVLDAGDYKNPKQPFLRRKLIDELLKYQKKSGGFCIDNSLDPEVDMTAMAVQALAPYYKEDRCKQEKLDVQKMKKSIDKAVEWIAGKETDDAEFIYDKTASSESISQVILALCALGRDPGKDERFTKKNATLLDALAKFRREDGMYMHEADEEEGSAMATYQAMIALEAVQKLRTEKKWIFDFK